jgi:hypothetical protein
MMGVYFEPGTVLAPLGSRLGGGLHESRINRPCRTTSLAREDTSEIGRSARVGIE